MSLHELPWNARTLWGVVARCLALNSWKTLRGRMGLRDLGAGLRLAAVLPLLKAGVVRDPIESATYSMTETERQLGIRSTIYVMPFPGRPGHRVGGEPAPGNRACFYQGTTYARWFRSLADEGWEIGVHGIDSHLDLQAAREEKASIEGLLGRSVDGIRMHWLYHCGAATYEILHDAGYLYDATLGSNHTVGWLDGRYEPFRGRSGLWVLPLVIQDGALLGDSTLGPCPAQARLQVERILAEARARHAVVTILWHNNSFAPPRCWGDFYEWIIRRAQADRARIMTAREVVEAYRLEAGDLQCSGNKSPG